MKKPGTNLFSLMLSMQTLGVSCGITPPPEAARVPSQKSQRTPEQIKTLMDKVKESEKLPRSGTAAVGNE